MVLGGVGWDRKEFLESNLHVYGRDDTKIVVYSMGRCTKKRGRKKGEKKSSNFDDKTENSCNFVHQQDIIQAPQVIPRMVLLILLVFNSL